MELKKKVLINSRNSEGNSKRIIIINRKAVVNQSTHSGCTSADLARLINRALQRLRPRLRGIIEGVRARPLRAQRCLPSLRNRHFAFGRSWEKSIFSTTIH